MNNKGQALVEFIIVFPILIMLLLAAFDYVRINQTKMELESRLEEIIISDEKENNTNLDIVKNEDKTTYFLKEDVEIYSPILVPIIDSHYEVKVKRVVYE